MLRRAWFVFVVGWAAAVLGLQMSSDPNVPRDTWATVGLIAALPWLAGKLLAFIVRGPKARFRA
jgi:hypothetical protein